MPTSHPWIKKWIRKTCFVVNSCDVLCISQIPSCLPPYFLSLPGYLSSACSLSYSWEDFLGAGWELHMGCMVGQESITGEENKPNNGFLSQIYLFFLNGETAILASISW